MTVLGHPRPSDCKFPQRPRLDGEDHADKAGGQQGDAHGARPHQPHLFHRVAHVDLACHGERSNQ